MTAVHKEQGMEISKYENNNDRILIPAIVALKHQKRLSDGIQFGEFGTFNSNIG